MHGMSDELDDLDRRILRALQADSTPPLDALAAKVGSSKTPVWNRIKKLKAKGVIKREVAVVDPEAVGLDSCFFITVKTNRHDPGWLADFMTAIQSSPEIMEAHRLAGEIDYILKVRVENAKAFDAFYKRLIGHVSIYSVTSSLSMEEMKSTTELAI